MSFLVALITGALNLLRGHGRPLPSLMGNRILVGIGLAGYGYYRSGWEVAAACLATAIGLIPAWQVTVRDWTAVGKMTLRGLVLTGPTGVLLIYLGHGWAFLASGLLLGVVYRLAWLTGIWRLNAILDGPVALAELVTGMMLGGALWLALAAPYW